MVVHPGSVVLTAALLAGGIQPLAATQVVMLLRLSSPSPWVFTGPDAFDPPRDPCQLEVQGLWKYLNSYNAKRQWTAGQPPLVYRFVDSWYLRVTLAYEGAGKTEFVFSLKNQPPDFADGVYRTGKVRLTVTDRPVGAVETKGTGSQVAREFVPGSGELADALEVQPMDPDSLTPEARQRLRPGEHLFCLAGKPATPGKKPEQPAGPKAKPAAPPDPHSVDDLYDAP